MGAQWPSGRVLDSRPRSCWFEPHWHHCVMSLSKNINPSLVLVQPRKTCPCITEILLMGRKESLYVFEQPRLRQDCAICTVLSEPWLFAYLMSTKISALKWKLKCTLSSSFVGCFFSLLHSGGPKLYEVTCFWPFMSSSSSSA